MGRRILIIITIFRNCKFQLIINISNETRQYRSAVDILIFCSFTWCNKQFSITVISDCCCYVCNRILTVISDCCCYVCNRILTVISDCYCVVCNLILAVISECYCVVCNRILTVISDSYCVVCNRILTIISDCCVLCTRI